MITGKRIYELLCDECRKKADKVIMEDGVINSWDDMLKDKYKDKKSNVQW